MPDFMQFAVIAAAVIAAIGVTGALTQAFRARLAPDASLRPADVDLAALEDRIVARLEARLRALEQAVEVTAIEVERIGEAQRYASRLPPRPESGAATPLLEPASEPT
jgi:hypothetical protein